MMLLVAALLTVPVCEQGPASAAAAASAAASAPFWVWRSSTKARPPSTGRVPISRARITNKTRSGMICPLSSRLPLRLGEFTCSVWMQSAGYGSKLPAFHIGTPDVNRVCWRAKAL